MRNQRSLSVIIPVHNGLPFLQVCLQKVADNVDMEKTEIIVIDNASDSETREWLRTITAVKIVENNDICSTPASFNQGITMSSGEMILLLHSDTVLPHNAVSRLEKVLYASENAGAVGPVSSGALFNKQTPKIMPLSYHDIYSFEKAAEDYYLKRLPAVQDIFLENFCVLLKRVAVEATGRFDEAFAPHYMEMEEYSLRMLDKGYRLWLAQSVLVYHERNVTAKSMHLLVDRLITEGINRIKNKTGIDISYSSSIRRELIERMDITKKDLSILDVGCACGGDFLYLQSLNPTVRCYGIELNDITARVASKFAEVRAEDVEKINVPEWEDKFDYIIMGDIIEHLRNPLAALKHMYRLLKHGGKIVISTPNIGHISIILNLLNARFPYADSGILDRTHVHFFTKIEMLNMLTEVGFKAEQFDGSIAPLSEEENNLLEELLKITSVDVDREQLLFYQHFYEGLKV